VSGDKLENESDLKKYIWSSNFIETDHAKGQLRAQPP
jgi:hypothetical protein